jgi:ribosome-associated protein
MIAVTDHIFLDEDALVFSFVQSSGPGGQNVNKVATAALLRFDLLNARGIPWEVKVRASRLAGSRLTQEGEVVIQAQRFRSQERNRADAVDRLVDLIRAAAVPPKPRVATRPTRASQVRRVDDKSRRGSVKRDRRRPDADD